MHFHQLFNFYQYKMTQCNSLNVKLSNSQLNKLKSAIKNETKVVLRLSSNVIGDNETDFPHQLLITNRQVSNLHKSFVNHSSTNIKLSKTQLSVRRISWWVTWPITKNRITINKKCK